MLMMFHSVLVGRAGELYASFQRGSEVSLGHSKSCMKKGLDGNLLWN